MGNASLLLVLVSAALALFIVGCGTATPTPTSTPVLSTLERSEIVVLGDIDPTDPVKKIRRFQPLADYPARQLGDFGIRAGQVEIARDIPEMGRYLREGVVDIYFDSVYPTLEAQRLSDSEVILRRWKRGNVSYSSMLIVLRDGGITSAADLQGKVVAFEEPYSTSGFLLPASILHQEGYVLRELSGPDEAVAADEVGYFFGLDEQNTVELLLTGQVAAGGFSNEDYDELPPELQARIMPFGESLTVPRQLVSVRPGLDADLVQRITELLVGLELTDEGKELLEGLQETKRFDPLPPEAETAVDWLRVVIPQIIGE